jgi:Ni,Fe-hydrogenase III small subunit
MLEWIFRGLGKGIVTTRYPHTPEAPPDGFRGRIEVAETEGAQVELEALCPTGAIAVEAGRVRIESGRCVVCGACVAADPTRFRFAPGFETAYVPPGHRPLAARARPLKRSIHIRHVDAGSDGAEEWEITALTNPYYDIQRLGFFFTAAPRHADVLLVSGGVTAVLEAPLRRTYEAMPEPKVVVAAGTDACSGGFSLTTGEVAGGLDRVLPVDVYVPGSPPSPIALLHGLLLAAGIVEAAAG